MDAESSADPPSGMLQSWSWPPSDPGCFRCELVSFGEGLPTPPFGLWFGEGLPTPPFGLWFGEGLPTPPFDLWFGEGLPTPPFDRP